MLNSFAGILLNRSGRFVSSYSWSVVVFLSASTTMETGNDTRREVFMDVRSCRAAALIFLLSAVAAPLWAHHGDAGRYDESPLTLAGSVVELQMINPHSIIVLDVPEANGKTTRWQAEMVGPNALAREFGWTRTTLKPGDKITLIGRRVKSGAPYISLIERAVVYMTDSKKLLFRTANAEVPKDVVIPAGMGAVPPPAAGGATY
jgi:hypothetical protein